MCSCIFNFQAYFTPVAHNIDNFIYYNSAKLLRYYPHSYSKKTGYFLLEIHISLSKTSNNKSIDVQYIN